MTTRNPGRVEQLRAEVVARLDAGTSISAIMRVLPVTYEYVQAVRAARDIDRYSHRNRGTATPRATPRV